MERSDLGLVARYLLATGVLVGGSVASTLMLMLMLVNYVLAGGLVWLSGACGVVAWATRGGGTDTKKPAGGGLFYGENNQAL